MRVFLGIGIAPPLQKEILLWSKQYKKLPVRWLSGENLHVTLVPPWEEYDIESLKQSLADCPKMGAFEMSFERASFGPSPREPRLIWAEGKTPNTIPKLNATLERAAARAGEKRIFRLHLTIARFRPEDFSSFSIQTIEDHVVWKEEVKSFRLYQSHLAPTGARYETLEEFSLV
jgi:2'-5' RNA ligase